jgi:hypothetical protein
MSIEREMLGRFTTDKILFVIMSGYFTVFIVPVDLIKVLSGTSILEYNTYFQAFANFNYLSNGEPQKSAIILGIGLSIGIAIMLLYSFFEWVNHIPKYVWDKEWSEEWKKENEENKDKDNLEKEGIEFCAWNNWIRQYGLGKTHDFICSMREISAGLLYGSEISLFITVLLVLISVYYSNFSNSSLVIMSFLIFAVLVVAYKFNQRNQKRNLDSLIRKYKAIQISD